MRAALDEMREHYDVDGHGVELVELGGGWQILTRAEYTEAIERAQLAVRPQRLSGAALETLAIIAYRQPIGRAEIEEIRGVDRGRACSSRCTSAGSIDVVAAARGSGARCCTAPRRCSSSSSRCATCEELPRADELAIALRARAARRCDGASRDAHPARARARGRRVASQGRGAGRGGPRDA